MTKQSKIIGLTAIGGALEFYDFTIYALFAPYLSQHFFAEANQLVALINTYLVFALGYLARPIGGIVFGHLGDKFGRKYAFSLAILLMAGATLCIGLLPSYQAIGITATFLLVGLRLIQGFSVGGEIPGSTIFILEHVAFKYKGLALGIIFMCITLGNTLGALIGLILTSTLSSEHMLAWGWRIPFILGFILGIISFIIRIRALETPVFLEILQQEKIQRLPLWELIKSTRKKLLMGFCFTAVSASTISLFLYLPAYLSNILQLKISYAYLMNFMAFLVLALTTAISGWLSDYIGRKKLMLIGSALLILSGYGLFYALNIYGNYFIWIFVLAFAILTGIVNGCYGITIAELFSPNLRYSGMGLSYSLGFAIFGGVAPFFFTYLIKTFGDVTAPSYYLIVCAAITFIAVLANVLSDIKTSILFMQFAKDGQK